MMASLCLELVSVLCHKDTYQFNLFLESKVTAKGVAQVEGAGWKKKKREMVSEGQNGVGWLG